jgi:hypothetical protein
MVSISTSSGPQPGEAVSEAQHLTATGRRMDVPNMCGRYQLSQAERFAEINGDLEETFRRWYPAFRFSAAKLKRRPHDWDCPRNLALSKKCGFTTVNERPHPAISASERACRRLLRFGASCAAPTADIRTTCFTPPSCAAQSAFDAWIDALGPGGVSSHATSTPSNAPRRCGGATDRRYAARRPGPRGPWPWPGRERDRSSDGRSPAGIGSRRR